MLVIKTPPEAGGIVQLVLLDHGLYKELSDDFRLNYCRLWQAIINQDEGKLQDIARLLGVENYPMFASMLTARSWESVQTDLSSSLTVSETQLLRDAASLHAAEITRILAQVPPQLLLLLKTNDLLRAVNTDLGSPINPYAITLSHCLRVLYTSETATLPSSSWSRFWTFKDYVVSQLKVYLFSWL